MSTGIRITLFYLLIVLGGVGQLACDNQISSVKREKNNSEARKTVESYLEAVSSGKYNSSFQCLDASVKKLWMQSILQMDYSHFVDSSEFKMPNRFLLKDLKNYEGDEYEYDLYDKIMKMADSQNANIIEYKNVKKWELAEVRMKNDTLEFKYSSDNLITTFYLTSTKDEKYRIRKIYQNGPSGIRIFPGS